MIHEWLGRKTQIEKKDNPSEEDISESSLTKEQHETIKVLNEKARMLQQKHLKP